MRFIVTLLLFTCLGANGQQVINLWSETHPAPHKTVVVGDETAPDDMGRIGNISIPTIEVFLPTNAKNVPAVVICPGGGYEIETMYNEGTFFAKYLADNGIAGIVLKYRIPKGVHQLPLEDAERALDLVRENAAKWGVDPEKIGVMGFSAGGHLAAITATMAVDKPAFSVLFYPVISLRAGIGHSGSRNALIGKLPLADYYSAELNVSKEVGPTLIFHCMDDYGVSIGQSYLYAHALHNLGVESKVVAFEKGGHGWGFSPKFPGHEQIKKEMVEWIKAR